tara:strand:+ start:993 stop:1499 length:507 start_codon:yes stop_codon:yes gene_type:complete
MPVYLSSGLNFPDTQSTSSTANVLDDYEEGTWTPVFVDDYNSNLTTSNSLNTVHGANYVKIGRIVHCNFSVRLTTTSGSVNFGMTLWLSGVPFNVSTDYQGNTGTVIGAYTLKKNSQASDRYTSMSVGVVSTGVGGYERIYLHNYSSYGTSSITNYYCMGQFQYISEG